MKTAVVPTLSPDQAFSLIMDAVRSSQQDGELLKTLDCYVESMRDALLTDAAMERLDNLEPHGFDPLGLFEDYDDDPANHSGPSLNAVACMSREERISAYFHAMVLDMRHSNRKVAMYRSMYDEQKAKCDRLEQERRTLSAALARAQGANQ
jgi:hypothetical protein